MVDVDKGEVSELRHVVVGGDGKVRGMGASKTARGAEDRCWARLDCRGMYALPGLCDAHVHATAYTADFGAMERASPSYVAAQAAGILRGMLLRGFTTVRDAGGADFGLCEALKEGLLEGPRLLYCGKALSQTGGHGDMRAAGDARSPASRECLCCAGLGRVCDGEAEVRRAARDEVRKGATHLKVMASGGVSSPTDRIDSTQFSVGELRAACEEAAAANIPVMAHAYTPLAIQRAAEAGATSVEHGNLLDGTSAVVLGRRGVTLVPTLVTYWALAREGLQHGLTRGMLAKTGEVLDAGRRAVALALGHGVKMAFGSDLLGGMHRHQLHEFALLEEAGVSRAECLRHATSHAARLFRLEGLVGTLRAGAYGDIVLVHRNPLDPAEGPLFAGGASAVKAVVQDGCLKKLAPGLRQTLKVARDNPDAVLRNGDPDLRARVKRARAAALALAASRP